MGPAHGLMSNDTNALLSLTLHLAGIAESTPKLSNSLREIPGIHHCVESKFDNICAFVNFVVHRSLMKCYF